MSKACKRSVQLGNASVASKVVEVEFFSESKGSSIFPTVLRWQGRPSCSASLAAFMYYIQKKQCDTVMVKVPAVCATFEGPSSERKSQNSEALAHIISNKPSVSVTPGVLSMQTAAFAFGTSRARARGVHVQIRDVDDDSGPGQATQPL